MQNRGSEREVVMLMTDMVQYSQRSSGMTPEEIRDFLIEYHESIHALIENEESYPMEIESSGGDGCIIIFDKRPGEDRRGVCTRALSSALKMAEAISTGSLIPTRMGILLGSITEAKIGYKMVKFGASFAVANRLEELCGWFGTHFLMDREVARYQKGYDKDIVSVAKVSLTSVLHPLNIFTIYRPGIQSIPVSISQEKLREFVRMKNEAMEYFCGNQIVGLKPNFPKVREQLLFCQGYFQELTGRADLGIERILEYIRETPFPEDDFNNKGMKLMEKKRDSLGERLFHLSRELLKAMRPDFYHALVVDTSWEKYFRLEWFTRGETVIEFGSIPDGIYYLDTGVVKTYNERNELLSVMEEGSIFGEMAYFGQEKKRTATVIADTNIVVRKISSKDFEKLPTIIKIFEQISWTRKENIGWDRRDRRKSSGRVASHFC